MKKKQPFNIKTVLLAFEYGLVLSNVMKYQKREITPELVERCEKMITKEFSEKTMEKLGLEMMPNLLSVIETE